MSKASHLTLGKPGLAARTTSTGNTLEAELCRLSTLLGAAEQLVPQLEQEVGAESFSVVTAIEALLECARTSLAAAVKALEGEKAHG